jgi:Polyketide cyclase / dehydrase and lipid transport
MRLQAEVIVRRAPDDVAAFLGDVRNIPLWDRGVAGVRAPSDAIPGVGFAFETLGHQGSAAGAEDGRMAYQVSAVGPEGSTVRLTSTTGNARYFKDAWWHFRLDPVREGTRITCAAEFTLRLRYLFLVPVLYLMRRAISDDLERVRRALEAA